MPEKTIAYLNAELCDRLAPELAKIRGLIIYAPNANGSHRVTGNQYAANKFYKLIDNVTA